MLLVCAAILDSDGGRHVQVRHGLGMGVPPERLGDYLREFAKLLAQHGLDGLIYGHLGDGCVHVRLDFPFSERPSVSTPRGW